MMQGFWLLSKCLCMPHFFFDFRALAFGAFALVGPTFLDVFGGLLIIPFRSPCSFLALCFTYCFAFFMLSCTTSLWTNSFTSRPICLPSFLRCFARIFPAASASFALESSSRRLVLLK